ncbi:hypothetical protein BE61_34060 [Bradyrhizobium elkanii USDA 61]|nr:hypothetical protein BE61_34060 [Bradyrhizobium elkanii USDA 61]
MPGGIVPCPPPERDGGTEPCDRDRGIGGHSAAKGTVVDGLYLLAVARKEPIDAPDLIKRG